MSSNRYDFEALYFDIYKKVVKHNDALEELAFDKNQLREITTSIFIAYSQRGIVSPMPANGFVTAITQLLNDIKERHQQEHIYRQVKQLIKSTQTKKEDN